MVKDFIINGGYEIEKSEDDSYPFAKINIEEQERNADAEDYFNGENDAEEEKNVIYLEDVDNSDADGDDKDDKET